VSSLSGNQSCDVFHLKETHFFSLAPVSLLLLSYINSVRISWDVVNPCLAIIP
jgi:hypothetical protein